MHQMPPSRRNVFAWLTGAAAFGGGAGWLRAQTQTYHDGPVSDHFDGVRFRDPLGAPPKGALDMLRWIASGRREKWPEWAPSPYADRPPARVGTTIRIGFVGHASLLIQSGGVNLLCDPVWSERASPVVITHAAWAGRAPAARAAGNARASRMAVRALRPLRRPVSTIEQRAA